MNKIKMDVAKAFHDQHGNIVRLACEAGVDRETIKNFMYTDKGVNLFTLLNICDALGLEVVVRKVTHG